MIGDKRSYLTCLIMIDHDNVVKFAQDQNVPFTNYASLCRASGGAGADRREVEAVNKKFARVETIKKFRLIDALLTAEDEELTPTMKLKRSLVEKKYGELIKDMYASRRHETAVARHSRQAQRRAGIQPQTPSVELVLDSAGALRACGNDVGLAGMIAGRD